MVQVDALLDEVWVIFGLVDDDRADAETKNQEDDESKYWGVYCVLFKKLRIIIFKYIFQFNNRQNFVNIFDNSFIVAKSPVP